MPVHLDGMVRCSGDEFIFTVGGDGNRALRLARKLPAIDKFAGHLFLPDEGRVPLHLFGSGNYDAVRSTLQLVGSAVASARVDRGSQRTIVEQLPMRSYRFDTALLRCNKNR